MFCVSMDSSNVGNTWPKCEKSLTNIRTVGNRYVRQYYNLLATEKKNYYFIKPRPF